MLSYVALVALVLCSGSGKEVSNAETKCRHTMDGESVLVRVLSSNNYALASPELLSRHNWTSVYMNGQQLSFVAPDCKITEKSISQVGELERRALESLTMSLQSSDMATIMSTGAGEYLIRSSGGDSFVMNGFTLWSTDELSWMKMGDGHYVMASNELREANLDKIMVDNDLVTLVTLDGRITMKPCACLDEEEQKLLQSFEQMKSQKEQESREHQQERELERQQRETDRETRRREREAERERKQLDKQQRREEAQLLKQQRRQARYLSQGEQY